MFLSSQFLGSAMGIANRKNRCDFGVLSAFYNNGPITTPTEERHTNAREDPTRPSIDANMKLTSELAEDRCPGGEPREGGRAQFPPLAFSCLGNRCNFAFGVCDGHRKNRKNRCDFGALRAGETP